MNSSPETNAAQLSRLITQEEIAQRIDQLAARLAKTVGTDWVLVALMDGALVFAADLLRALHRQGVNPEFENMTLSSYGDDIQSAGEVKVEKGLTRDVSGRSVLIVDDVFETGLTLQTAAQMMSEAGATEVKTCVFAQKTGYNGDIALPDFSAWDAPDAFLVGYGMDFKGRYRGLPFIADLLA